jgi:hypothetical protein
MKASEWLKQGQGGGSAIRPGFGRMDARFALVRVHNTRGEAVFLAARRWHAARASTQAAKMRLRRALDDAEQAEQDELQALRSMGIGRRPYSAAARSAGAPPPKPGGYRERLEQRVASYAAEKAQAAESAARSDLKRAVNLEKANKPPSPGSSPKENHRAKWLKKQMAASPTGASPTGGTPPAQSVQTKKPRSRGGGKG